ncbi:MAG TPA: DNA gyrase subunit A [Candidatus Krumholzibacterium sp.]|nr:DNA gyrase subunit A [Candidatus Krumholzibacterium sp.]
MDLSRQKIIPVYIEDEMRSSYLDYSMSVIVSRALPDVRDGLKPVHRRILLAMNDLNLVHNRPYRKSAKLTGDVTGNYHPHGTASVYDAVVRLAQDFSLRYPLVDGQGNFGSIDGDPAAAERYTEVRMQAIAEELLADIDKETVEFGPNYDETREMALVLPSKVPNLLINGASGIAVGMATNIPPHNLSEIVSGLKAILEDPEIKDERLYKLVSGPDFPTGGIIYGRGGIREAYKTGKGKITVRAKANIETQKSGKTSIVISEIPYQTNKAAIIMKIAELVRAQKLTGIADIRDESDKDGLRVVVDLKRDSYPKVVLNQLFKHTQLQVTFGIIMLSLNQLRPEVMNLRKMMTLFLEHREEVITRRTRFDLRKAEERAHILEGYKIALDNIDAIVKLIKQSASPAEAKNGLMKKFALSEIQAQAILDMKLQRLTGLERKKIEEEYLALIQKIEYFRSILENRNLLLNIIKDELTELQEKFGDERRTKIVDAEGELDIEDLIAEEDMIITITHSGYIKRIPIGTYKMQRRGGKGITGLGMKEEDFVEQIFIASTHSYILFFTDAGKCYWLKVHEVPQGGRLARGKAIVNLLEMSREENITAFIPVSDFGRDAYLTMATRGGLIKKTHLSAYSNPRRGGIIAINLQEGDLLVRAKLTSGNDDIILAKRKGKAIRFNERDVREMGRGTRGVKGVTLDGDDEVVEMVTVKRNTALLIVTENGYGKRTKISEFRNIKRGGKGVVCIPTQGRNGDLVTVKEVIEDDEAMIITKNGMIIRCPVRGISLIHRPAQGVRVINLNEGDSVVDVTLIAGERDDDSSSGTEGGPENTADPDTEGIEPEEMDDEEGLETPEEEEAEDEEGREDEEEDIIGEEAEKPAARGSKKGRKSSEKAVKKSPSSRRKKK